MLLASSTDLAISLALKNDTLKVEPFWSERFSEWYWAISDKHGLIETHLTEADARKRIA